MERRSYCHLGTDSCCWTIYRIFDNNVGIRFQTAGSGSNRTWRKRYDFVLDESFFDGTTDSEKVKEFVRDEFGLELVHTNMPIKMLVVEKTK